MLKLCAVVPVVMFRSSVIALERLINCESMNVVEFDRAGISVSVGLIVVPPLPGAHSSTATPAAKLVTLKKSFAAGSSFGH